MATINIVGNVFGRTNSRRGVVAGESIDARYLAAANGTGERYSASQSISGGILLHTAFSSQVYKDYITSVESFMSFDFSSVPAGTINSATLKITYYSNNGFVNQRSRYIYFYLYDWGASVDTSDYIAGSSASSNTLLSTVWIYTQYPTAGTQWTGGFSSSEVSKRTITKLALVSGTIIMAGTAPYGGTDGHYDVFSDQSDGNVSYRPTITIDYTPAGASSKSGWGTILK